MTPYIALLPIGPVDGEILGELAARTAARFPWELRIVPGRLDPAEAWSPERLQHSSTRLLRRVGAEGPPDAARLLGVGELDLFISILTFVFGEAELGGRSAVLGLTRLRQEFYGLPPDRARLLDRAVKEAVHELGHTFSLVHCRLPTCVMASSPSAEGIDVKGEAFCSACAARVRAAASGTPEPSRGVRRGSGSGGA